MVGHSHEVERPIELNRPSRQIKPLALGKSKGIGRGLQRAIAIGIERIGRVNVKVAPIDLLGTGLSVLAVHRRGLRGGGLSERFRVWFAPSRAAKEA